MGKNSATEHCSKNYQLQVVEEAVKVNLVCLSWTIFDMNDMSAIAFLEQ